MPHVNGLRALAIIAVLLYHLNPSYCSAGYFGVDVFLVISGYFLFRSLLKPEKLPGFRYTPYILAKAWRILPSWAALTCIVCIVACFVMLYKDCRAACGTACASSFFSVDYLLDHHYNYFNPYTRRNLLLHLWYLSITVQLYLIAPLLVVYTARKYSRKSAHILLFSAAVLSLAFYILTTASWAPFSMKSMLLESIGAKTTYYHLIPRFWEPVAGYLVLFLPPFESRPGVRNCLAVAGMALIGASCFLAPVGSPLVYGAVLGAMLLIRYGSCGMAARLLNLRPVQLIGTISFSLYLWHWPVITLWEYFCFSSITPWDEAGMLLLSFLLAALAWFAVERRNMPVFQGNGFLWKRLSVLAIIPLSCVVFAGCMLYSKKTDIPDAGMEKDWYSGAEYNADAHLLEGLSPDLFNEGTPVYLGNRADSPPFFLLMGDSHAAHLNAAMHQACCAQGVRGIHLNNRIVPFWWFEIHEKVDYDLWNRRKADMLVNYLQKRPELRYVVISMLWADRLQATTNTPWDEQAPHRGAKQELVTAADGLRETCRRLNAIGKRVILLEDTPKLERDLYALFRRARKIGYDSANLLTGPGAEEYRTFNQGPTELMAQLHQEGLVHAVIPAATPLLNGQRYMVQKDGAFLYRDDNHLSAHGSGLVSTYVLHELMRLRREDDLTTP